MKPSTSDSENHDLRDSGISMSDHSTLNNFNNSSYEDFDLNAHQQEMNIHASPIEDGSPKIENPPPIPPKSNVSLNSSFEFGGSLERKRGEIAVLESASTAENYSVPKMQNENGENCSS